MNPVCVELPWPPIKSSPNGSQGDWRGKARAGRDYKRDCWAVIKAAGIAPMSAGEVEVNIIFCPPDNRRRDLDGCLTRAKRGLDALSEAIGVDDSRWNVITLERGDKVRGGSVIVSVMPSRWRSIGCITASMVEKKTRERLAPSRAVATHNGDATMGYDEANTRGEGAQ